MSEVLEVLNQMKKVLKQGIRVVQILTILQSLPLMIPLSRDLSSPAKVKYGSLIDAFSPALCVLSYRRTCNEQTPLSPDRRIERIDFINALILT